MYVVPFSHGRLAGNHKCNNHLLWEMPSCKKTPYDKSSKNQVCKVQFYKYSKPPTDTVTVTKLCLTLPFSLLNITQMHRRRLSLICANAKLNKSIFTQHQTVLMTYIHASLSDSTDCHSWLCCIVSD